MLPPGHDPRDAVRHSPFSIRRASGSPPADARARVVVGLMSGTSLDGISAAVVRFAGADGERTSYELLAFQQTTYSTAQRDRLAAALVGATPEEYTRLAFDLAEWLSDAAVAVIAESGVPRADISAIASHGQTIWHVPVHSTWQLGESAVIAERTGIGVVHDFRVRDVAAGGQGAPLVPMADALLFSHPSEWRALQNLGGIGNVTLVPAGGDLRATRAFDTGPGCVVMDGVVRRLATPPASGEAPERHQPRLHMDTSGALASAGTPVAEAVQRALEHPYFRAAPPKSTGRELFTPEYIHFFITACRTQRPAATVEDCVASAVQLTAESIADAFRRFVPEPVTECILSGGGAENPALVKAITRALAPMKVSRFSEVFFDGEAKEAVAFALLGYLFLEGRPGNVPSVTGARGPRILGKWTPA